MVSEFLDSKLNNMAKEDFEVLFIGITVAVAILAVLCILIILCRTRCCRKRRDNQHRNPLIVTSKAAPIAVDTTDIDFIDSKDTKLISSTVQVKSLHNSPISA